MSEKNPVFLDATGRRWRRVRRVAIGLGVLTTAVAAAVVTGVVIGGSIPTLRPQAAPVLRKPANSKAKREHNAERLALEAAIARYGPITRSRRPERIPPLRAAPLRPPATGKPIMGGFFVNWDENSFASLQTNIAHLDWVVLEWAFVAAGGDSVRITEDRRIFDLIRTLPPAKRPKLLVMVSNFDTTAQAFASRNLRLLLTRPAARARAIAQLTALVAKDTLDGVTVDFEESPELEGGIREFVAGMHGVLAPRHKLTTVAVASETAPARLRQLIPVSDALFLMLFDEHYAASDAGPIASQSFYEARARAALRVVPRQKLILMIGAYGYDWNDLPPDPGKTKTADEYTVQDIVRDLRDSGAVLHFDRSAVNPYITFTSPDSTDHLIWYLDGATAYNELRLARELGVAGSAVWRLGSEDPSLWRVLGANDTLTSPESLQVVPPGYDVEIQGAGEVLEVPARPHPGTRRVQIDSASRFVASERFTAFPTPWIVQRYGVQTVHPHWVALTFDDGPDGRWTQPILDTLASRGVKATFFVIGVNVETHVNLLRRELAQGHEIGNHTFTHPNLGLTRAFVTRLELSANQRIIESLLDRGTALFRPPFFGDAEPTTVNELAPIAIATAAGYLTVGLHVDSQDWTSPPPDSIIANVLASRPLPGQRGGPACRDSLGHRDTSSCNIVLLHDGGGFRGNTVAALGRLIDSLRARGDTLVLVSQLVGLSRAQIMPVPPGVSRVSLWLQAAGFQVFGDLEWVLFWVFTLAVVLGIGRLVVMGGLALLQRVRQHQHRDAPAPFAPGVTVIIPAYNEVKVIVRTVHSILEQRFAGDLEVLVVDDGSRDDTYATAVNAFRHTPSVSVLTKSNGGKASALNFGVERARHEIVICLDADTIFASDTVAELVQPLADPAVAAVAGNAKVGNRINVVTRWQALEYVTSQNLDRRAFSLLDCITVVPGAVGAWRRTAIREAGGFRSDTLAEDQDLTLSIRRRGHSVAFADGALAYTEAPDSLGGLARQRFRWSFGTLQCAWKHRDVLFRRRYGSLGWVAMPNVWLFQLILPAISPIADLMFLWSLVSVWLTWIEHGGTFAVSNLEQVLFYYAVFLVVDWAAAMIAFLMEEGEDRQLTWLIFIQRFAYRQVMYWVVVRSFTAAVRGRLVGWGKLERKATVGRLSRA